MEIINIEEMHREFIKNLLYYFATRKTECASDMHIVISIACMDHYELMEKMKIDFAVYCLENWNAFYMDIVKGKMNYINLLETVWKSYMEESQ